MLSTFNLAQSVSIAEFQASLDDFENHMIEQGLIHDMQPLHTRSKDTPMDTDADSDLGLMFITRFRDRQQCDAAYAYIEVMGRAERAIHLAVSSKVRDALFSCWEEKQLGGH